MDPKALGQFLMQPSTADVLNTPIKRGSVLPFTEYVNRTEFDPFGSGLTGMAWNALTAPARAARGEISEDQQIPEAFNFAGSLTLGSLLAPRPTSSVGMGGRAAKGALEAQQPQGIRAFHGSPHDFERFSMDAIGSGEGAQAYGHGLYFAENEGVAKAYREALSDKTDALTPVTFEGRKIGPSAPGISGEDLAARFAAQSGGDARLARAHIRGIYNDPDTLPPAHKEAMRLLTEQPERFASAKYLEPGHMYEVNIKANPEDFLDWDKPLSQQSEKVREAALTAMERASGITRNDLKEGVTGADAVRYGGLDDPNVMTKALREAGIPGVRYLDQMSRGEGKGSSNYVVFDDNLIEILRKYGLLGPVAGGGTLAGMLMGGQDGETY